MSLALRSLTRSSVRDSETLGRIEARCARAYFWRGDQLFAHADLARDAGMMMDLVGSFAQMPNAQDDQLAQGIRQRYLVAHGIVEIDEGFRDVRGPHQHLPHIAAVGRGALAQLFGKARREIVKRWVGVAGHWRLHVLLRLAWS